MQDKEDITGEIMKNIKIIAFDLLFVELIVILGICIASLLIM